MIFKHLFNVVLNWPLKQSEQNTNKRIYKKSHQIIINGKPELITSAAKTFKGDPNLYNPEDLLLSSLTSCHMMSYLYCCDVNNIEVISYTDSSQAVLEVSENGAGKITEVTLNPVVLISDANDVALAIKLHQKANELCFIANSCNFLVHHNITCKAV